MTVEDEEAQSVRSVLANPRLERLLAIGCEMNDLRSKIQLATDYIAKEGFTGGAEDVVLAREALRRNLERSQVEARDLMPVVEELVSRFEEQIKSIENERKLHQGLAKIEGMDGASTRASELKGAAGRDRVQVADLRNLMSALDELERDLTMSRDVVKCPRCYSHDVAYRITPSELGYSLYRCRKCSNAWRIQRFSMRIG